MIDKTLIEKFLKGECQHDEAAWVLSYLREHPAVVEEFLPEEEWDKYVSGQSSTAFDGELYQNIHNAIHRGRRTKVVLTTLISAAAVLFLFFGIRYLSGNRTGTGPAELAAVKVSTIVKKNTTSNDQSVLLPDSSFVTLSAGSEIKYTSDYNTSVRDIHLTGKAEFSVAKNKEKQFTVFCGKVATTALGTRFSVDGNAKSISVVLYEGKVLVKKIQDERMPNYLLPGDMISFNIQKDIFEKLSGNELAANPSQKHPQNADTEKNKAADPADDKPVASQNETELADNNGRINFQNKNLKTVLDQLAERFNVEINYPTEISSSINVFISVDTTQSIDRILHNIAAINNLEVKKVADKKFYISNNF